MRIKITQNIKGIFEADFSIYDGVNQIGTAKVNGSIKSPESIVEINICGEKIKLSRSHSFMEKHAYRPYTVQINELESGNVFQTEKKRAYFLLMVIKLWLSKSACVFKRVLYVSDWIWQ